MKGEHVWVRHLLDDHMTYLPVAEVDIECDSSTERVTSKAAVIGNHLDQGQYIMGNQTAALLQGIEENCPSYVGKSVQNDEQTELNLEEGTDNLETGEILPPVDCCSPINPVNQINSSTLFAKQQNIEELAPINSDVSSKTDVDAYEPMPASTEGNN
ncbi:retrovirus-related Pol polyprotein from transposon 17.6 [Trichonephila clavipes]|nr:retrovirus-related Pol polyprotein from transposon 17.6 [Trichonephila clavipes]